MCAPAAHQDTRTHTSHVMIAWVVVCMHVCKAQYKPAGSAQAGAAVELQNYLVPTKKSAAAIFIKLFHSLLLAFTSNEL